MNKIITLFAVLICLPIAVWGQHFEELTTKQQYHTFLRPSSGNPLLPHNRPLNLKALYDIKQKLDAESFTRFIDSTGLWKNTNTQEYLYDVKGNLIQQTYFYYLTEDHFIPQSKYQFDYDDQNWEYRETSFRWDTTSNAWIARSKYEYSYDPAGNIILAYGSEWDAESNQWNTSYKEEYQYFEGTNLLHNYIISNKNEENNQWVYSEKGEMSYTESSLVAGYIYSTWDPSSGQWIPQYKYESTYRSDGNCSQDTYYSWNALDNKWVTDEKDEFSYDTNNIMTRVVSYSMDSTNEWKPVSKSEFTNDNLGNRTQSLFCNWNPATLKWVNSSRTDYSFNNAFTRNDLLLPSTYSDVVLFSHMLDSISNYRWDSSSESFKSTAKRRFSYSETNINSVTDIPLVAVKVYPNPAQNMVIIESGDPLKNASLELFDALGRKVISKRLSGMRIQIPVYELKQGLYTYQIIENNNSHIGRIMIQ